MAAPATAAAAADLERQLHGFLSLEAPFLIPHLPPGAAAGQLEARLLALVEEQCRSHPGLGEDELWPGVRHADGVAWGREALAELVKGFFARQRIKASLTAAAGCASPSLWSRSHAASPMGESASP